MKRRILLSIVLCPFMASAAEGDGRANPRLGTDEVQNQITLDREANPLYESRLLNPLREWRDSVAEKTALNLSIDYSALYVGASDSAGAEDTAGSGMVRFFGFWDVIGRGGPNKGSLNWKIENRHRYTEIPASALGFESGYVGLFGAPFSDQGDRLTVLNWKQYFADGNAAAVAGWIDATDYVDVYLLASPWLGFVNFAFSTGSAAMDLPNDAALGTAIGGMVAPNLYLQAGIADANSDPTDPFEGFDTTFSDSDFFKWVEIGFTPGQEKLYLDNLHLTLWHVDERLNGTPDGWGLNASYQRWIDDTWLPFIRGGYTEDSGSLLENSVSVGIGHQPVPMRGVIGAGFSWGRPNPISFPNAGAQYTTEVFWRYQLTRELAITPTLQFIRNPALNAEQDDLWAFGIRARLVL